MRGLGVGWRPELGLWIHRCEAIAFVELMAEDFDARGRLPPHIEHLVDQGRPIVLHGTTLSLGSADPPDPRRLDHLARLAEKTRAAWVSEHLAFVRGGGLESGHLLPLPREEGALAILVENLRAAQGALPAPLAVENIASLVEWPDPELDEATFVARAVVEADVGLLLDLENLHANARNHGVDPVAYLDRLPLERLAYVHVAGGLPRGDLYYDTHTEPTPPAVLELVLLLAQRRPELGVLIERDGGFPADGRLDAELAALSRAMAPPPSARWAL